MKPIRLKIQWGENPDKNKISKQFIDVGASILPEGPFGHWVMCQDEHIASQACDIAHKNGCVLLEGQYKRWDPFAGTIDRALSSKLIIASLEKVYP